MTTENNSSNSNNVKMLKIPIDLHAKLKSKAALKKTTLYDFTVQILEKGILED